MKPEAAVKDLDGIAVPVDSLLACRMLSHFLRAVATASALAAASAAYGQTAAARTPGLPNTTRVQAPSSEAGKWEIAVHGGLATGARPTRGESQLPQPGAPITTSSPIFPSWQVPSWFFGDGAKFLNDVNAEFDVSARISPLDAALSALGLEGGGAGVMGIRAARDMRPRLAVEAGLELLMGSAGLSQELRDAAEDARASFESAFTGLFASGPFNTVAVAATTAAGGGAGNEVALTGAVTYTLPAFGRLVPYATAGGGLMLPAGSGPSIALEGNYRATAATNQGSFSINETDRATVRMNRRTVPIMLLGGGVRRDLAGQWGFRLDGRVYLGGHTATLLIDADPDVASGTPAGFIESLSYPNIQFSNATSTGRQSTLSAPGLAGFEVFKAEGFQARVVITVGLTRRF